MQLNIAVCNDREKDIAEFSEQMLAVCEEKGISAQVYIFRSGEELLASNTAPSLNIIFIDIYMDGISRLKTAHDLPAGNNCRVVFITFSTDHAVEAFGLNAAYYLINPTTRALAAAALERCVKQTSRVPVNVLVSHYADMAREREAAFSVHIQIPEDLPIRDTDISVIIGNPHENAIDAVSGLLPSKRSVKLNMIYRGNMLAITVNNTFNGVVNQKGGGIFPPKASTGGWDFRVSQIFRGNTGAPNFATMIKCSIRP